MKVVSNYPDGVFAWVDLTTTDVAAAKAFYAGLFDWEPLDLPIGDSGMFYTNMQIEGHNVAGMGEMMQEMKDQGVPSHWMSYVKHDDVNAIAERVQAAGGTVLMPPMDIMEEGRMALFVDPTGATFGVWQPANHIGAELVNMANTLVWNELQTSDMDATKGFYGQVFDWSNESDENGYVMYRASNGRMHAGSMQIDPSWGEVPPNWSVYFMVDDVDGMAAKAQSLGATILNGPMAAGEMGRFAVVADPTGAVFNLMSFNGPVDEPPGY